MPESNSKSIDSKNQSISKETEQEKRNLPKKDLADND